ncbi:unnamed protein product, partial [Oppiella nova]
MTGELKILFIPVDAIGHVNSAIGIAQVLLDAGHQCIFAINNQWKGRLIKYGFQEVLLTQPGRQENVDPAQYWSELFVNVGAIKATDPLETLISIQKNLYPVIIEQTKAMDPVIEKLLVQIAPDVIVVDLAFEIPAVARSGIPWVFTCSFNPLMAGYDERVPPPGLGLPSIGLSGHQNEWNRCRQALNLAVRDHWSAYNKWVQSRGLPALPDYHFYHGSPYLNIYGYPLELDYLDMRSMPPKWHRFDNLKRTEREG